jgi:cytochrome c-type biogenesis protein CcmH
MRAVVRAVVIGLALLVWLGPAAAVLPDEILEDPVLEARARAISLDLRCLVCQNQSIDDSNAQLARDLRLLVRERLVAGDTDAQVFDYVVDRYGEFVLLRPRFAPHTYILWLAPLALLLFGVVLLFRVLRSPGEAALAAETRALSEEERARLASMLGDDGDVSANRSG